MIFMKQFRFDSQISIGAELPSFSLKAIRNEPMLHKCDITHAIKIGGPITKAFIERLPVDWRLSPLRIDSRAHMLMPGWFPCIPGYHHDDVPREREDGQPNYSNPSYQTEHVMALWGDCSLTEFATGTAYFPDVPLGGIYYKEWHPLVEKKLANMELSKVTAPERRLIYFDWQTWHKGTAATKNGWRFFIRATRGSKASPANERRWQTQVYMEDPMSGW